MNPIKTRAPSQPLLGPTGNGKAGRPVGARTAVMMVAGSHFVHDVFSSFLPIVLPLLIVRLDLSLLAAGSFTFFFRLPTFFSPLIGRLADARDLGALVALAPGITAVCMSLLGNASGYEEVCLLVLVAGFSSALLHVLGPVSIARMTPGRYGSGMGLWMLGGESARAFGPVIAAWCLTVLSVDRIYPVMGIGILFSLMLMVGHRRPKEGAWQRVTKGRQTPWKSIVRRMLPFATAIVARGAMVGTLVSFLPTYLVSTGLSLLVGGLAFALMQGGGILATALGGWAGDRYGHRRVLSAAFLISSVLLLVMVGVSGWALYAVLALLGIGIFAVAPVQLALLQATFDEDKGAATGLYTTINFAAMAVATVFSGWIADLWGFRTAFVLNAFLGAIAVPTLLWMPISTQTGRETKNETIKA